jgi:hypothetical protein
LAVIDRIKNDEKDVETLLPWYEKSTLPDEDARLIEDYLKHNPEDGRRHLELIRDEVSETIEANERAGMPSAAALDRLMASVVAEPKREGAFGRERVGSVLTRSLGRGAARWLPAAMVAACLLILVQGAMLGVLIGYPEGFGGDPGSQARLTRGVGQPVSDEARVVLIRFNPTATAKDITTLLNALDVTIVEGPKLGGVYRVRISNKPLPSEQIDSILRQMRERSDIINFVSG